MDKFEVEKADTPPGKKHPIFHCAFVWRVLVIVDIIKLYFVFCYK